jgi:hypothetical protein
MKVLVYASHISESHINLAYLMLLQMRHIPVSRDITIAAREMDHCDGRSAETRRAP